MCPIPISLSLRLWPGSYCTASLPLRYVLPYCLPALTLCTAVLPPCPDGLRPCLRCDTVLVRNKQKRMFCVDCDCFVLTELEAAAAQGRCGAAAGDSVCVCVCVCVCVRLCGRCGRGIL